MYVPFLISGTLVLSSYCGWYVTSHNSFTLSLEREEKKKTCKKNPHHKNLLLQLYVYGVPHDLAEHYLIRQLCFPFACPSL